MLSFQTLQRGVRIPLQQYRNEFQGRGTLHEHSIVHVELNNTRQSEVSQTYKYVSPSAEKGAPQAAEPREPKSRHRRCSTPLRKLNAIGDSSSLIVTFFILDLF